MPIKNCKVRPTNYTVSLPTNLVERIKIGTEWFPVYQIENKNPQYNVSVLEVGTLDGDDTGYCGLWYKFRIASSDDWMVCPISAVSAIVYKEKEPE